MKKILLLILFSLLFPSIVLAKGTCNHDDIKIEEITIEEKEGNTEELAPVSIDNNKINLNLEMYTAGESITYKIKVKNNSNNDYYFTKDSFSLNTDYLEYSILNDSAVIKSNEEKEIELKITYKKQILEDEFNENNMMSITLSDTPLSNPSTKRTIFLILLVTFITIIVITINRNKKLNRVLIGILICSNPLSIKALCTVNLEINANITINEKEAIFLPGPEVNVKMKELTGDDTSISSTPYYFQDENITAIKQSLIEPIESEKQEKNIVSTADSPYPIYMWYEEGIIYWWSEAHRPKLNQDASFMFSRLANLDSLLPFTKFNTINTTNMMGLFTNSKQIRNLESLENWNTSNVTNMQAMFSGTAIENLHGLENWNTSKLQNISIMFQSATNLKSIEALKNWDTSNVTDMIQTFYQTAIENLHGLENWNTSKVIKMSNTFSCTKITSLEYLENWDVSNVTNMSGMFSSTPLTSLHGLENWDTSSLINLDSMFSRTPITSLEPLRNWNTSNFTYLGGAFHFSNLTNLSGLENWDVSKVTSFYQMFAANDSLEDVTAITDWDIQSTASFTRMFWRTLSHPEFSKVSGVWDSSGTFIPS